MRAILGGISACSQETSTQTSAETTTSYLLRQQTSYLCIIIRYTLSMLLSVSMIIVYAW